MSSLFSPGTIRGKSEPQESQKSRLPIATMLLSFLTECLKFKFCVDCLVKYPESGATDRA
jgi:hypothetical protein